MMWRRTLALLILAATAACAGSAGTTEQTLRFRLREDPPTIDPAFVTDQVSAAVVRRLHAGLVDFDPETLEIVPRVAERWDISDDGTIYTFHLRKGVLFHNGREVTAEDAAWSLRRLVDPATHSQRAWILSPVRGATAFREGQAQDVEGTGTLPSEARGTPGAAPTSCPARGRIRSVRQTRRCVRNMYSTA